MFALGVAALAYLAICLAAFLGQRALLYPAPRAHREPRAPGAALVEVRAPSGARVFALHAAPRAAGDATVVCFHGNGEDLADQAWLLDALRSAGLGYFAVEYPGYGLARDQSISESAIYEAAEAALRHLQSAGQARVVLLGVSLGSGVALEMARRGHGSRLALVAPYTSIPDVAAHHFGWLPVRLLLRDRFDSAAKALDIRQPTLIVHGTADEVVPHELGARLAKLLPGARLLAVQGAHHNDVLQGDVLAALVRFLADR
jgi:pimeloyl-ACP methyl ester carboxylesterase